MTKKILPLIFIFLLTAGLGCQFQSKKEREATKPIELNWWGVFDDSDALAPLIEDYRKVHPNISVIYRKLRPEEYERELVDALAEDRGPDIFMVHNTALIKYQPKLLPLPRELEIAYLITRGKLKKETVVELRKEKTLRLDQLKTQFVDQVAKDVVLSFLAPDGLVSDRIYGLPLSLDTLVLYANRDLLNAASIPETAKTWEEFLKQVKKLTKIDQKGTIIQAGAALGTANNVERAADILSLLMMQNGTVMQQDNSILFATRPPGLEGRETPPGLEALRFYTDFANPGKEAYSWNAEMANSLDAFTSGLVAYFFGYNYHQPLIRARAPKLNLTIARVPQIDPMAEVNFANYWVQAVSEKTKHPNEAWDLVQFSSQTAQVKKYLTLEKKLTALRSLVAEQMENEELAVFASELLTAQSWYHGKNPAAAEEAIKTMIADVVSGLVLPEQAIGLAASKVAQTLP